MKAYATKQIKNIALLGNSNSGKTTLAEAMLFEGKVIDRRGTIEANSTVSDYTDVEHLYQRSFYPTALFTEYMDYKVNILDTPGSDDFIGGVCSALRVADACVMVVNAQNGVEVETEILARHVERNNKPMILVINQLDHEKANFDNTLHSLKQSFGNKAVLVQYPLNPGPDFNALIDVLTMKMYRAKDENGTREILPIPDEEMEKATQLHSLLVEAAAENDEKLMELFFEKGVLDTEDIRKGLTAGICTRSLFPVLCTSSKKFIGAKRLMEFIVNAAPAPDCSGGAETVDGKIVPCDSAGAPSLFVFKTTLEQHLGEVTYFRVMSGKITEGLDMQNIANDSKERISTLYASVGKRHERVAEMYAGDIGCTVKLKNTKANQTLNVGKDWAFKPIEYPEPKFRIAIKAKIESEDEKLGELLNRAHQEDPTILVEYSKELKQIILSGQGEHHINILKWQLNNAYKLDIELYAPKIPYRETITKPAAADYRHKKQSGGAGQFGEVHLFIEPYMEGTPDPSKVKVDGKEINLNVRNKEEINLDWGGKLVYYNCIVGGSIDARFIPAILKGIMEKMEEGPLTGSYARDIRVAVYDGKMHPVDSNEISFKLAGRNAFKTAFKNAGPKIMEPIYNVKVYTPADCMGDVMGDLQNRRAIIEGMNSDKGIEVINARVPLAELYKYSTTLSSLTSGRATYTMKFAEYQQVPSDVQEKLLKAYEAEEKDE